MRRAIINLTPLIDMLFILLYILIGQQQEQNKLELERERRERSALQSEQKILHSDLQVMSVSYRKAQEDLQSIGQQKKDLFATLLERQDKVARLTLQLDELDQQRYELLKENSQMQKDMAKLKQILAEEQQSKREAEENWRQEYQKLREELLKAKQDMVLESQKLDKALQEKLALQEKFESKIQTLSPQVIHWEQKYNELLKEHKKTQEDLLSASQTLQKEGQEKTTLQMSLQQKIQIMAEQAKAWMQEKMALQEDKRQLEDTSRKIQQELQKEKESLLALVKEEQSLKEQLLKKIEKLRNQIQDVLSIKSNLEKDIEFLQQQIATYHTQLNKLEKETANLRKELEDKTLQLIQQELANKEIAGYLQAAEKEKSKLQESLQQQQTLQQLLRQQYQNMAESFRGRSIHTTFMKSKILSYNFTVCEIMLRAKGEVIFNMPGNEEHRQIVKEKKELVRFLEEVIPQSIRYSPQRAVFLVLLDPTAIVEHANWIEEELKGMKVLYGLQFLP